MVQILITCKVTWLLRLISKHIRFSIVHCIWHRAKVTAQWLNCFALIKQIQIHIMELEKLHCIFVVADVNKPIFFIYIRYCGCLSTISRCILRYRSEIFSIYQAIVGCQTKCAGEIGSGGSTSAIAKCGRVLDMERRGSATRTRCRHNLAVARGNHRSQTQRVEQTTRRNRHVAAALGAVVVALGPPLRSARVHRLFAQVFGQWMNSFVLICWNCVIGQIFIIVV